MIKKYETSICSNQDGLELSVLWLEPEKEPKGILQISHGMSEYKERYLPFMRYLCERVLPPYVTIELFSLELTAIFIPLLQSAI